MTIRSLECWRAHRTRRWHTNVQLAHVGQTLADHAHGVATLILHLHPDPGVELIAAALLHDAGEAEVGDIPGPAKRAHEELAEVSGWLERRARNGVSPPRLADVVERLSAEDAEWLRLADQLEAALFAVAYGALPGRGWSEAIAEIAELSADLGVRDEVALLLREVGIWL